MYPTQGNPAQVILLFLWSVVYGSVPIIKRIPYIPSLNSKAALFIILSLSSAPGDLGFPFSASSRVKVSL